MREERIGRWMDGQGHGGEDGSLGGAAMARRGGGKIARQEECRGGAEADDFREGGQRPNGNIN